MSVVSWCAFAVTLIFSFATVVAGFQNMEGFCAAMAGMTLLCGLAVIANY